MTHNSATTIKCRFSNLAHKLLDPNYGGKRRDAWKIKNKVYTDKEKIEIFDKLKALDLVISEELSSCYYKRRKKKHVQNARLERGYVPKKKTKLIVH